MFTVYLIKVVWVFGLETLTFVLALIKCCWVAKYLEKLFNKIIKAVHKLLVKSTPEVYKHNAHTNVDFQD